MYEREIFHPKSEEEWLSLRVPDITSTMMPGLLNMSPYCTPFEIFHAKKNGIILDFEVTERMKKGRRMQEYALAEIGIDQGWQVEPMNEYIRIPALRMGSSFDGKATSPKRAGKGIVEIKAVDFFQFKDKWRDDDGEFTEDGIPPHIEVQLKHQLEVAGEYEWGAIAVFTGIYDYKLYEMERDRDFGGDLVTVNNHFWNDVANNNVPSPDYYRDGAVISKLYNPILEAQDFTADPAFDARASEFKRWQAAKAEAEKEYKAAKFALHDMLKDHAEGYGQRFKVKADMGGGFAPTVVTPEMVGTMIGGRDDFRACRVTDMQAPKKGKK